MASNLPVLPSDTETIAELRELYRAAEARAARMRLLSVSGRELAEATPETLEPILAKCAERLAFFLGRRTAMILPVGAEGGMPINAPGSSGAPLARLVIDSLRSIREIDDPEDRETVRMELDLMGTTIDRIRREQERAQLLDALQQREKSLEFVVERLVSVQEEERRRVSHELHDGVAQTATALVRVLESAEGGQPGELRPAEIARGLVAELRRVIAGLRPTLLDDLGFVPALRSLCEALEADGYDVSVRIETGAARHSTAIETALFRVAQEAFANIRKHAGGPCRVEVDALLSPDAPRRVLRIADNGCGPSAQTRKAQPGAGLNLGIEVMRERMTAVGGRLDWWAGEPQGVVVEAWLAQG
ncbi:two-component sensor histidine kinase [Erythrobacter sp. Dej080120_24]|uniref:sensor histidine kinase n=1 Tax=unclassified Erythrobacter TaxID=2633097 RepID=UPI002922EA48|nr:two-component sensor histidine kinase [Erythrobacter sp. Dej080120_24]